MTTNPYFKGTVNKVIYYSTLNISEMIEDREMKY